MKPHEQMNQFFLLPEREFGRESRKTDLETKVSPDVCFRIGVCCYNIIFTAYERITCLGSSKSANLIGSQRGRITRPIGYD